jgi:hypothetical protein
MANSNLTSAKKAKNDEFYTQFVDIQKEIEAYLEYDPDTFRGKVVYCNCDDPFESNFFRYFVLNFEKLGLKQLITTSYKPSPIDNVKLGRPNRGRPGKFVTITYKEIFPLIKDNKMWLGVSNFNKGMYFHVPLNFTYSATYKFQREKDGNKVNRVPGVCWFTNLEHGRRHKPLSLMTMADNLRYSKHKEIRGKKHYDRYDNYDAIEVPFTDAIPSDYPGVMGVPISWLDKYCPEQFEIVGIDRYVDDNPNYGKRFTIDGSEIYARILIRHRKAV